MYELLFFKTPVEHEANVMVGELRGRYCRATAVCPGSHNAPGTVFSEHYDHSARHGTQAAAAPDVLAIMAVSNATNTVIQSLNDEMCGILQPST
jgi:hypothetical protein